MLSFLASNLLWMIGWNPLTKQQKASKPHKSILIYTHTSYWDFVMFLLYMLAYPDMFGDLWALVKPQPFRYAGWILRRLQCLPATAREERGGGAISRLVEHLQSQPSFCFILSPKGSIENRPWRSGYRALANQCDCPIWTGGFDYEAKFIYLSPKTFLSDTSEEDLQSDLGRVVPLHPEQSEINIWRQYNPESIGVIDWVHLSMVVSSLMVVPKMFYLGSLPGVWSVLTAWTSIQYHCSLEQRYISADRWMVRIMALIYMAYIPRRRPDPIWTGLGVLACGIYWWARGWEGRENQNYRKRRYIVWHSLFHISLGLFLIY